MEKITFLGPLNATFSHDAYNVLAELYGAPQVVTSGSDTNYVRASSNEEVLQLVAEHRGYGALAMDTKAGGRIDKSLESFVALLHPYGENAECPFHVIGAVQLELHFCLMAREGVPLELVTHILTHEKSLAPCREGLALMGVPTVTKDSNGEAARLVAEDDEYGYCAALGPRCASETYSLTVLHESYEDKEAITTFFLVGPKEHKASTGAKNRTLIVFKVPHRPGALARALQPFGRENLDLIQIHSVHVGNHTYNFAIELDVKGSDLRKWQAMDTFKRRVEDYLVFGPFQVLSR